MATTTTTTGGGGANILSAVEGRQDDVIKIRRAIISVSDKTGIIEFAEFLASMGVEILSTGGTAKKLRSEGGSLLSSKVMDVSTYTGAMECLDGRVKTLHPSIHGGLLAVRGNEKHEQQMKEQKFDYIDMTIINLYPFEKTIMNNTNNKSYEQCIENIDIGGPSMLRSTAKNHMYTTVVTDPSQYAAVQHCMTKHNGCTTLSLRKQLAATAFAMSAKYDSMIATYMSKQLQQEEDLRIQNEKKEEKKESTSSSSNSTDNSNTKTDVMIPTIKPVVTRVYEPEFTLKYGCNPHQKPAQILSSNGTKLPFEVLNGTPGYINLLDAMNAWQLVTELKQSTGYTAAASFKHVSPAGAAIAAVPLSDVECDAYEISKDEAANLTPASLAYIRARNADPMCSFGDFSSVSDIVDEKTAIFLKKQISDGIIAAGYTSEAFDILKTKKNGKFIILQADPNYIVSDRNEYREVYGVTFMQRRNDVVLTRNDMKQNIVTENKNMTDDMIRDCLIASICIKYTQSNSIGFCTNGMMIGIGAGQQSRIDCVKLAMKKAMIWKLRQHGKVIGLQFKDTIKKQDRINARVQYIENNFSTIHEQKQWEEQFITIPQPFTEDDQKSIIIHNNNTTNNNNSSNSTRNDRSPPHNKICLSSDAFFPFRDNIDVCTKIGTVAIVQPGGSIQDETIIQACNEYNIIMGFTNVRLFHH